ncbi:hypothetical protein [Streptomyces sp. NPDC051994]|uniref:hypothetical protein n=1 Tax=Streptomyces sp. NPDC051994 TaxID=3155287 RepID=UPI00341EA64E
MGLFSRKTQDYTATAEEIDSAARAIARDDSGPADRLCDRAGANSQGVAMAILARSVDYTPQED